MSRPGAQWHCEQPFCKDAKRKAGLRGDDLLVAPDDADCAAPRMMYIHGGSWTGGGPEEWGYDVLASKLAGLGGAVVLVPDYRLVPEGNYSDILSSALAAWLWLADHGPHAKDCTGSPRPPLFVGGDSAGGGSVLSFVMTVNAEPDKYPIVAGAFTYSPVTNLMADSPTYYLNNYGASATAYTGDILYHKPPPAHSQDNLKMSLGYVASNNTLLADAVASPLHATASQLVGAPPLYMAVSGTETLASDSIIFAYRAAEAGVDVILDIFPGMWHVFPMYSEGCGKGHELWQGSLALNRTAEFLKSVVAAGGHTRHQDTGGLPTTFFHYPHPSGTGPWIPVQSLSLSSTNSFSGGPGLSDVMWCILGAETGAALVFASLCVWRRQKRLAPSELHTVSSSSNEASV